MRISTAILLACMACGRSAKPDEAQRLLGCWRKAIGVERLRSIRVIARTGTIETGGLSGPIASWIRTDGATRDDYAIGPQHVVQVFDGTRAWTRDGRSQPHEITGAELRGVITDAYADTLGPLLGRGTVERGPDPWSLVLRPTGGDPMTVRLDEQTCLPRSRERLLGTVPMTTRFADWEATAGIPLPRTLEVSTPNPGSLIRVRYTSTQVDPVDSAKLFARPDAATYSLPDGLASVEVPIELADSHIFVPVTVDGRGPAWFLLDTGADVSHVDTARAHELGLVAEGSFTAAGAGSGVVETGVIANVTLGVGAIRMPTDALSATPLAALSEHEGRRIEGILGYDVLGAFAVELDYAHARIRFHDAARFSPPANASAVPMTFYGHKPVIPVDLALADGSTITARAILDTGSDAALIARGPYAKTHDLRSKVGALAETSAHGLGGESRGATGTAKRVRIGATTLDDVAIYLPADAGGAFAGDEVDASIGGKVLRRLHVVVDYAHQEVWVAP